MTNLQSTGEPGTSAAVQQSTKDDNKYIKKIDDLIEEAEIEAELEAEKKIRSKNTKMVGISILGLGLLLFMYLGMNQGEDMDDSMTEGPVTELTVPIDGPAQVKAPKLEMASLTPAQPEPAPPAPVIEETPAPPIESKKQEEPAQPAVKTASPETPKIEKQAKAQRAPVPVPVRTKAPQPSGRQFFVQTGVFSEKANADRFSRKLSASGFSPRISTKTRDMTRHLVHVGLFADANESQSMGEEIKAKGFKGKLIKTDDGNYTFQVGNYGNVKDAEGLQNRLSLKGLLSSRVSKTENTTLYVVDVGGFSNRKQAKNLQAKLDRAGYKNHFVH